MGQNVNTSTEYRPVHEMCQGTCPSVSARTALQQLRGTLGTHALTACHAVPWLVRAPLFSYCFGGRQGLRCSSSVSQSAAVCAGTAVGAHALNRMQCRAMAAHAAADNDQVIIILLASLRNGPGQSAPVRCLPR